MSIPHGVPCQKLNETPEVFLQRMKVTEAWVRGDLTNFEYVSQDITQYPVFPWVLNDYSTTEYDVK